MKQTTIVFSLFLFCLSTSCRNKSSSRLIVFDSSNYLLNNEIEHTLNVYKDGGFTARKYALVSEYQKVLESMDFQKDSIESATSNLRDSILNYYQAVDAIDFIIKASKNHEFLFLNEAHFRPYHKTFLRQLLAPLKEQGYQYLALEATGKIREGDARSKIQVQTSRKSVARNSIKYDPTQYRTLEPEFGTLVKEAIDLDYIVFGYDEGSGEEREIKGAKNILEKIQNYNEGGKTIVFCGWDHIKEVETGTYWGYALAGRIKEYTGTDPLTINQTRYSERSQRYFEDSIYQLFDFKKSTILIDKNGNSYNNEKNPNWYDLMVFHPRTQYQHNIPHWITDKQPIREIELPPLDIVCPCKVFLFKKNEDYHRAVPTYVCETTDLNSPIHLPIGNMDYHIIVSTKDKSYLID